MARCVGLKPNGIGRSGSRKDAWALLVAIGAAGLTPGGL